MKKLTTILLATAALLVAAVSCNKEGNDPGGQLATINYLVSIADASTKTLGDGTAVNKLAYAIYDGETKYASGTVDKSQSGSFEFMPSLFIGKEYDIVLFAYKDGSYNVAELTAIKKNAASGEDADAFCLKETVLLDKDETIIVNGDDTNVSFREGRSVVLVRQFAQLNVGTSSVEDLAKAGAAKVKVLISDYNAATYNVRTAEVTAAENISLEYVCTIDALMSNTFEVDGQKYNYVSLNYLFPVGNVTAVVSVLKEDGTVIREVPAFTNLPLKANQKTNIYGNLVKGELTFNVTMNAVFTGTQDKTIE